MTQRELADKVKTSFTYISKIESGAMPPPSQKVISQLAEVLNTDQDELIILAGKVPLDIVPILKNRETLQHLRSNRIQRMLKSSGKNGGTAHKIGHRTEQTASPKGSSRVLPPFKSLVRVVIPLVLVIAVAASLWFVTPVRALEISFPSQPSDGFIGDATSFTMRVTLTDPAEGLPIQSVKLELYNTADPTTYKATLLNLPLIDGGTKSYTDADTGGGTASVTATGSSWSYGYGYGYATWQSTSYYFGYGYGYGGGSGTRTMTYSVTWTSPVSWPEGAHEAKATLTVASTTFTKTSSEFTLANVTRVLSSSLAPSAPGVTGVSDYIDENGVFAQDVAAESDDSNVVLNIGKGTIGLIDGQPVAEISITEIEDPPDPPAQANFVVFPYEFGPPGTTFDPEINLAFHFDPNLIPPAVAKENLVIAVLVDDVWVPLTGPFTLENNTISTGINGFSVFAVIAYTRPATFTDSALTISPAEVEIGESVTISVLVNNTGDLTGSHWALLKIDNTVVATKAITLAGGASQRVTFTTTKDIAGTYTVNVDGLVGAFTVKAPPVPVKAPSVPVKAPPVPVKAINWWLIGGAFAVSFAAIVLIILLVVRRRRN